MFETTVREGVCRVSNPGARWLATGWNGGYGSADAAINVTVPEGFDRTDLASYVTERRARADFEGTGPALLTGVAQRHARGARAGSVTAVATAGLSNPAALPLAATDGEAATPVEVGQDPGSPVTDDSPPPPGTVNLLVGTERSLADGTLATLLATAVEAKTGTLRAAVGFTGTTSDAVAVGCDPSGDAAPFAGSGTALGAATRACVRDAVLASLDSRYSDAAVPTAVDEADHGVVTRRETTEFRP